MPAIDGEFAAEASSNVVLVHADFGSRYLQWISKLRANE
jgi:hypothetical protein